MADNTVIAAGTGGDVIATDDVAGVKYQRVKIQNGGDGVAGGDVTPANPLPTVLVGGARAYTIFTATALACVAAEALVSLTPYRDLVAGAAATTHAVTAGKRLRLTGMTLTVRGTGTANVGGVVRLRLLAGAVLVGSPVHATVGGMSSTLATAVIGHAQTTQITFPDGLELDGAEQLGLTQLFSAATATIDVQISGYEYTA